ncbi:WD40/YVTN/BNR-like repeat-containing protein [Zavarzinia compransoris]|nr:YCF48-related protein [Zavarzinia compransoris]TDP43618.1 photosystem II stability/assembly factor-like uncharacterized protein [Zavarzinia compransoris]
MFRSMLLSAAAALALLTATGAAAEGFRDLLDTPAEASPLAARTLFNGLAVAGGRVVAVGQRGHIMLSDNRGTTWRQAQVPVSTDLVAVHFPTPRQGWAVGHDGVVLHSADGGETWMRQLDGRTLGKTVTAAYSAMAAAGELGDADQAAAILADAERFAAQGVDTPILDVWFADEKHGFVVGAFNLILKTEDGGQTWRPWFHRTDNPRGLHFYAVRPAGGALFIAGEQGLLLRWNPETLRFAAVELPYNGTLFGIAGAGDAAVVFGLRGNAFRSADGGVTWDKVETGVQVGLTGAAGADGRLLMVSQAGHLLVSADGGQHFQPAPVGGPLPAAAVADAGNGVVVIAGPRGLRALDLSRAP